MSLQTHTWRPDGGSSAKFVQMLSTHATIVGCLPFGEATRSQEVSLPLPALQCVEARPNHTKHSQPTREATGWVLVGGSVFSNNSQWQH